MQGATELTVIEQYRDLEEIALARCWFLNMLTDIQFVIGMAAPDRTCFHLFVDCEGFPGVPPAFHWYNLRTKTLDEPKDTPKGGGYFHDSGRICAPWNRLAYKKIDPAGPHSDWELANWMTNSYTGSTTTLSAMAIRIYRELYGPNFKGRKG
ncbi:MAG: hypothetical protein HZB33_15980 [Nitrospirae bacterium]|nr:hypothetical protein [Nitrospirota bacterium]